jgi:hypothetical protein
MYAVSVSFVNQLSGSGRLLPPADRPCGVTSNLKTEKLENAATAGTMRTWKSPFSARSIEILLSSSHERQGHDRMQLRKLPLQEQEGDRSGVLIVPSAIASILSYMIHYIYRYR